MYLGNRKEPIKIGMQPITPSLPLLWEEESHIWFLRTIRGFEFWKKSLDLKKPEWITEDQEAPDHLIPLPLQGEWDLIMVFQVLGDFFSMGKNFSHDMCSGNPTESIKISEHSSSEIFFPKLKNSRSTLHIIRGLYTTRRDGNATIECLSILSDYSRFAIKNSFRDPKIRKVRERP